MLLQVKDVYARVEDKEILKGISLNVNAGEVHAIMGPNGSGKSTLAKVIVGHPAFELTQGDILFEGQSIKDQDPEERARHGIFLAFQYPVEIPGVNNAQFLRLAYNAKRQAQGLDELDPLEFDELLREKMKLVEMDESFINRAVNEGFSGGEKKKNEILQMAILEPKLVEMDESFINRAVNEGFSGGEKKKNEILQMAILEPKLALLDETDSGLDIDALREVAHGVNKLTNENNAVVMVTHYQRLLNYIQPDYVHVLFDGRIIKSGGKELALALEEKGYDWVINQQVAEV